MSFSVVIVGAGNVATHISKRLKSQGIRISQVYSRTEESAKSLANMIDAEWTTDPKALDLNAKCYFLALKDSELYDFLNNSVLRDKLLIHCSGSLDVSVLAPFTRKYGVIYPLQTFSKSREINVGTIPLFIEASDSETEIEILTLALKISTWVNHASGIQRMKLHIAAVFACNFVNHMYSIAGNLLESSGFGFEIIQPLIRETTEKVHYLSPKDAQTGPAVRNDFNIIEKHLTSLLPDTELIHIYEQLSQHISTFHQK